MRVEWFSTRRPLLCIGPPMEPTPAPADAVAGRPPANELPSAAAAVLAPLLVAARTALRAVDDAVLRGGMAVAAPSRGDSRRPLCVRLMLDLSLPTAAEPAGPEAPHACPCPVPAAPVWEPCLSSAGGGRAGSELESESTLEAARPPSTTRRRDRNRWLEAASTAAVMAPSPAACAREAAVAAALMRAASSSSR